MARFLAIFLLGAASGASLMFQLLLAIAFRLNAAYPDGVSDRLFVKDITADPPIAPHTQSCHAKDNGALIISYNVHIGEPYNGGALCGTIKGALAHATKSLMLYRCVDDGNGDTTLHFNAFHGLGGNMNNELEKIYPEVNEFNCPDY